MAELRRRGRASTRRPRRPRRPRSSERRSSSVALRRRAPRMPPQRPRARRVDREPRGGAVAAEARRGARRTRRARRGGRRRRSTAPTLPVPSVPAIRTTGRWKRSTSREATIPITPSCQSSSCSDVAAPAPRPPATPRPWRPRRGGFGPRPPAARGSAPRGAPASCGGLVVVLGQQQLQRGLGMREAARCVDPRRETEADRALVDGGRIDAARSASARAGPASACARALSGPARARHRFSSTSGTTSEIVAIATRSRCRRSASCRAESACAELVDDAGAAELRERIVRRPRGDDRAVRQLVARPVVVGDDDVEPARFRLGDLLHRGDPAVDGERRARSPRRRAARASRPRRRSPPRTGSGGASRRRRRARGGRARRARWRRSRPRRSRRGRRSACPAAIAARIVSQAAAMPPSRKGRDPAISPARNARAVGGVARSPRRRRTRAVVSLTPSPRRARAPRAASTA